MKINGTQYRTIWTEGEMPESVRIIDQRQLPHDFVVESLHTVDDATRAIHEMHVRGAPLVGTTAAFGMFLAAKEARESNFDGKFMKEAAEHLKDARPTAVNLKHSVDRQLSSLQQAETPEEREKICLETARKIREEELESCRNIGEHGQTILERLAEQKVKDEPVNVLTHCNAGWLACIDYGTATAPIYMAHDSGLDIHVWVDETRPRNQGARLTAWELNQHGVPHTVVADSTAGFLMQTGRVDAVIVGTDRTTARGDVANKIGTYQKALAAEDNDVPFYVALPASTIDWELERGTEVPIEERNPNEVTHITGKNEDTGRVETVRITPPGTPAKNYAFDVTPSSLITHLITDRGICRPDPEEMSKLYSSRKR